MDLNVKGATNNETLQEPGRLQDLFFGKFGSKLTKITATCFTALYFLGIIPIMQNFVLCIGENGHVQLEVSNLDCCGESGNSYISAGNVQANTEDPNCINCVDSEFQELFHHAGTRFNNSIPHPARSNQFLFWGPILSFKLNFKEMVVSLAEEPLLSSETPVRFSTDILIC